MFGDFYAPKHFGSGGGSASNSSGLGGGRLWFEVSHKVILDGTIRADGEDGTAYVGSGSGGSIYIQTKHMEGWGTLDVSVFVD